MAKFFVGQRVKVVSSTKKENLGIEANIESFVFTAKGTKTRSGIPLSRDCNCAIVIDSGLRYAANTDQLEPILPEGNQPCGMSYEEMMQEFKEKVV